MIACTVQHHHVTTIVRMYKHSQWTIRANYSKQQTKKYSRKICRREHTHTPTWLEYFWRPKSENKCGCRNKEQVAKSNTNLPTRTHKLSLDFHQLN